MTTKISGDTGVSQVQTGSVGPGDLQTGIPIPGTVTNDNAGAGFVGEHLSASRLFASPLAVTNSIVAEVTSLELTAGDWDVQGRVGLVTAATTSIATLAAWCDTSLSAISNDNLGMFRRAWPGGSVINTPANGAPSENTGVTRISLAVPTTVYLVAFVAFSVSTASVFGSINARRVR